MKNIFVHDLRGTKTLDSRSMSQIRGGWFGGIVGLMAESTSDADRSSPALSEIVITKKADTSSAKLF